MEVLEVVAVALFGIGLVGFATSAIQHAAGASERRALHRRLHGLTRADRRRLTRAVVHHRPVPAVASDAATAVARILVAQRSLGWMGASTAVLPGVLLLASARWDWLVALVIALFVMGVALGLQTVVEAHRARTYLQRLPLGIPTPTG